MNCSFHRTIWASVLLVFVGLLYCCTPRVEGKLAGAATGIMEYTIDAHSYEEWTYFSFSSGSAIEVSDPANSLDWDLGFQRLKIRANCGTSGPGNGGVENMGVIDFDSLTEAPAEGYAVDEVLTLFPGSPHEETVSINPEMTDWYNMTGGMPPTITSKKEVFVVRTADGKYAKIQLLDYYDKEGHSGFVTFKYVYPFQPPTAVEGTTWGTVKYLYRRDGSRNLWP